MWGYKIIDQNYKDTPTLIRYLVRTAGKGANLLLNIGPQPNGELPAAALERLKGMGEWLRENGETIYGTQGAPFAEQSWGTATVKDNKIFVHVLDPQASKIVVPIQNKVKSVKSFKEQNKVPFNATKEGIEIDLPDLNDSIDYILEINC